MLPITVFTLYRKAAATLAMALSNQSISQLGGSSLASKAGIRVNTSGVLESVLGATPTYATLMTWLLSGASSNFQVKAEDGGGDPFVGTLSTYLECNTSPSWTIVCPTAGESRQGIVLLTIKDKTTLATVSATMTITATRF